MRCAQCHGAMVVDHFLDLEDAGGHLWLRARFSKRPALHPEAVPLGI